MSKSDEILKQELAGTTGKQNVTLAEAKAEAATGKVTPETGAAATTPKAAKKPKLDGDGNPITTTPRPKIAAGSTPAQVLAAHITDPAMLGEHSRLLKSDKADDAGLIAATGGIINKLAKKVGEKAINLLRHRDNPTQVQVYTRMGLDQLAKEGTITSKGLVDMFSTKYKPGTARAQANQLMHLFPALQVATVNSDKSLVANKDSVILTAYNKAKG